MANAELPIHAAQMPRFITADGVRVREDALFTDGKGEPNDRSRKRAEEALAGLRDVLPSVLEPSEAVLYVIKVCQAPISALEQFFLGWQAYRVTSTRLVFTNLRLLHFGMDSGGKWNRTLKSVRWGDVRQAKLKGWLNRLLELRYANGKKERYWRLRRKDSKKAKAVVAAVLPLSQGEATAAQGFQSLCPNCRATLAAGNYQCAGCGLKFKDEKTLLRRTLLIPGGGYLYAGMTLIGVLAFLTEGAVTLGVIYFLLAATGLMGPQRAENGQLIAAKEIFAAAVILAVFLLLNKLLEYIHSRRVIQSFIPVEKP